VAASKTSFFESHRLVTEFLVMVEAALFLGEVLRDQIAAEERDAFYQTVTLSTVAEWLNRLALREMVERERAGTAEARP
jgi:hypothetical protein